jgi:hypothetical protein
MAIEYFKENFIGEPCNPGKLVNSGSLSSPAEHR